MAHRKYSAGMRTVTAALFMLAFIWGCDDEEDITRGPEVGEISGHVTFHGEWPDSGAVQLGLYESWNLEYGSWGGWSHLETPVNSIIFTEDMRGESRKDSNTTFFTLTSIAPGNYAAIVVRWCLPTPENNFCYQPIIGMYGANPNTDDLIPDEVIIAEDETTEKDYNFDVYFDRIPYTDCYDIGFIEGKVIVNSEPWGPGDPYGEQQVWPEEGIAVVLSSQPYTAWYPGGIDGYITHQVAYETDSTFRFVVPYGRYYVSLWTNNMPPKSYAPWPIWEEDPFNIEPIVISAEQPEAVRHPYDLDYNLYALVAKPRWVSGTIDFVSQRPTENIIVALWKYPRDPEEEWLAYGRITPEGDSYLIWYDVVAGSYTLTAEAPGLEYTPIQSYYGAYGYHPTEGDTTPDVIELNEENWGLNNLNFTLWPVY